MSTANTPAATDALSVELIFALGNAAPMTTGELAAHLVAEHADLAEVHADLQTTTMLLLAELVRLQVVEPCEAVKWKLTASGRERYTAAVERSRA